MIDGEGSGISSEMLYSRAWYKWAQKAAMFVLEHRYYGQSHPTPNVTTENMRWLSSR